MFGETYRHSLTDDEEDDNSSRYEFLETVTPRHSLLSGRFKQSFAYLTLRTRMPGIMYQIKANLAEHEREFIIKYGEGVQLDLRRINELIERLQKELQRDRQFSVFTGCEEDKAEWNLFITQLPRPKRTFFRACWLHAECYLYRKLYSFMQNSQYLKNYDYFADLKQQDLKVCFSPMETMCKLTRKTAKNYETFRKILSYCLWSSRYVMQLTKNPFEKQEMLHGEFEMANKSLLIDESIGLWNCLVRENATKKTVTLDFICDNAGFEFFSDMLLIEYLLDHRLASKVRLHVKVIPWYISDVMQSDIEWIIDFMKEISSPMLNTLALKWEQYFQSGQIEYGPKSHFWTGPKSYFVMCDIDPELYRTLAMGSLVIFKGDLNYRKLMGDYIWDSTEEFITCLRGFRPANICALRIIKSEVVCGLPEGKADYLHKVDPQWMITGTYGIIQYTDSLKCRCFLDDYTKESH